ncbi:unnamed protein product [Knipowitschia caucasica]
MKNYIALAVLLCAVASLTHGFCMVKPALPRGATKCMDDADGTTHDVGSHWINSECMECSCTSCCSAYATPRNFPPDCVSVFDKKNCKYIVHKKDNPNTLCEVFGLVG